MTPDYAAFAHALRTVDSVAERISAVVRGCLHKEPGELTEQEQICIVIAGGCNYEFTSTGIRVTDAFGIQKVDGKFIVAARASTNGRGDL